jgi:hypothetical protein
LLLGLVALLLAAMIVVGLTGLTHPHLVIPLLAAVLAQDFLVAPAVVVIVRIDQAQVLVLPDKVIMVVLLLGVTILRAVAVVALAVWVVRQAVRDRAVLVVK